MKDIKRFLVLFVLCIFGSLFIACSSNSYAITYNTNPTGALVTCENSPHSGYSPFTLYYTLSDEHKSGEVFILNVSQCKATFASGYEAYFNTNFDLERFPNGVMTTITRPKGEGFDVDMQFALQVEQNRAMQAQAAAAQAQAYAAQQQATATQQAVLNQQMQNRYQRDQDMINYWQNQQRQQTLDGINNNLRRLNNGFGF